MSRKPVDSSQAAARLLDALEGVDPLNCDVSQVQLPAFVEAERAGVDVDTDPRYADLLRHLEHCEGCLELYTELAEDLAMMLDAGEPLPEPPPMPAGLVKTTRNTERLLLRVFAGLQRRFEAVLPVPRLEPQFAGLGGSKRAVLLNEQLPEIDGEPAVSISVGGEAGARDLLVAVADDRGVTRWEIRVTSGAMSVETTTDDRGLARFSDLSISEGDKVAVFVSESSAA